METLHDKVVATLRRRFPDLRDGLDVVPATGRITGIVVSDAFDGDSDADRQKMLCDALQSGLSSEELRQIGPIVTMTPAEAEIDISVDEAKA